MKWDFIQSAKCPFSISLCVLLQERLGLEKCRDVQQAINIYKLAWAY